jgi:hypothetical protein
VVPVTSILPQTSRLLFAFILSLTTATPSFAAETPETSTETLPPDLARALSESDAAFRAQDYERIIDRLAPSIADPRLIDRPERLRLLELVGISHWFLIATPEANAVFGDLLRLSPFYRLDTFVYPAELIAFFDARRAELIASGAIPATPTRPEPPATRLRIREIRERNTPTIAFLSPFGVGQFINDEPGKGTTMAIIQGVGFATLATSWIAIETLKVGDSNLVSQDNAGEARLLEALWYGGAAVFLGTWGYSIVDGLINRETAPVILEREAPLTWSPTLLPGGLGASAQLRF